MAQVGILLLPLASFRSSSLRVIIIRSVMAHDSSAPFYWPLARGCELLTAHYSTNTKGRSLTRLTSRLCVAVLCTMVVSSIFVACAQHWRLEHLNASTSYRQRLQGEVVLMGS